MNIRTPTFANLLFYLGVLLFLGLGTPDAFAADCNYDTGTPTCTDNPCFSFENSFVGGNSLGGIVNRARGLLEETINNVAASINTASRALFTGITNASPLGLNFTFLDAIGAAILLYIIFYGVGLMFGFVQATLLDAVIRLAKLGFIFTIIDPGSVLGYFLSSATSGGFFTVSNEWVNQGGWGFFSWYVVQFFNQGTNDIIMLMVNIASGNPLVASLTNPCSLSGLAASYLSRIGITFSVGCPFQVLDSSVAIIFSPRMFITILGAISTPPYGIIMALALIASIFSFFMVLIRAMQVYALSLVAKAVLFGIAPIFISFMLFEKTKSLFQAWLQQVISYSLQPILLFTFLAFFGLLLKSAATDLLPVNGAHLCYTKSSKQANTPIDTHAWTFGCRLTEDGPVVPYNGEWTWDGAVDQVNCPSTVNGKFPLDPVKILIFLLLCYLMFKLSEIAVYVAVDLAGGAGAALDAGGGALQSMLSKTGAKFK